MKLQNGPHQTLQPPNSHTVTTSTFRSHGTLRTAKSVQSVVATARSSFARAINRQKPSVLWIYAEDIDTAHATLKARGADVTPLEDTAWGLRRFILHAPYRNTFSEHPDQ